MPKLLSPRAQPWPLNQATVRELTILFKSLADGGNVHLAVNGEMNVTAVGEEFGQSQPAVSHHLLQSVAERRADRLPPRREVQPLLAQPDRPEQAVRQTIARGETTELLLGGQENSLKRK